MENISDPVGFGALIIGDQPERLSQTP